MTTAPTILVSLPIFKIPLIYYLTEILYEVGATSGAAPGDVSRHGAGGDHHVGHGGQRGTAAGDTRALRCAHSCVHPAI